MATDNIPRIRVGCQANAWQREFKVQEQLPEALRQMALAGYDGAELPVWSIPDLAQPQAVRDLLAQHGLAFIAVHVGGNFYDPATFRDQALPAICRAAECAAAAGAHGMVISGAAKRAPLHTVPFIAGGTATPAPPPQHARKDANDLKAQRDNLAEAARLNRDLGLATYYHNHFPEFEHGGEEIRSILEVDPALLSLCFDIGNAARALPGATLLDAMEHYWERIGYLHYKDIQGDTLAEALGDGELDFGAIGGLARRRGFSGWATAEIEPAKGMVTNRTVLEDARRSCAVIRETLGI